MSNVTKILGKRRFLQGLPSCVILGALIAIASCSRLEAEVPPQPFRILYVNTKNFESKEAGRRLDFASFASRATALGGLNFNSFIFYQFHHFRENALLRGQLLDALEFSAKLVRARGEIPYGGTHIFPSLFASDPLYREDLARFFAEVKKRGAEPLAATGNTSWGSVDGKLVERPALLEQLKKIADWCTEQKVSLYVISDMSTTYNATAQRTQYPDRGDDGKALPRVLDVADPVVSALYSQFFKNLADLRKVYPALIGGGLEEFPLQGRFLQDDAPLLYGFSDAWKKRYALDHQGAELPAYNSLGGPGNKERMGFLDEVSSKFFDGLVPADNRFQIAHLNNYVANWRYKMSVPRGNFSGDPYVYDSWMLPSVATFLQPSLLEADPSLAENFHLLLLHPRGRALNQWHLEKRSAQFGTDRVAASWPFFMAEASAPLVGYQDQLLKVLPHFSGLLVLPYRITSDQEDEALADWVGKGNILLLGSFVGEADDGKLDPSQAHLPAKWISGQDRLLGAAGWAQPQAPRDVFIEGDLQVSWRDAFRRGSAQGVDISLKGMAGKSLALPKAPQGTVTFATINGVPYIQGVAVGKGWMVWHNILPFVDGKGRLVARYDSQEGWMPMSDLPTRLLRAGLASMNFRTHVSEDAIVLGNGTQTVEVEIGQDLRNGSLGYKLISAKAARSQPDIQWKGVDSRIRDFWEEQFRRYWPVDFPVDHFLSKIEAIQVEVDDEERDGFSSSVHGRTLSLKAANPRSALLGLYRILEKLGWRWVAPGQDNYSSDWLVNDPSQLTLDVRAALLLRGMMTHTPLTEDSVRWIDWLPKAGYNFFLMPGPYWDKAPPSIKKALADRALIVEVGAHSFDYWYPHQKYFPNAPDTFALVKGSRELPVNRWIDDLLADRQVATTHPVVAPAFAEALDTFAKKYPDVSRLSLWPNDGFGWDESPEARALDQDGMSQLHPGMSNLARRYLKFAQDVQDLRHTSTPATIIAYAATLEFPQGVTIPKGLPVYIAPYLENYAVPLPQGGSKANICYWNEINNWIASGANVTLFEYWLKYAWLSQPLPIVSQQQANIKAFAAAGGVGLLTQAELAGWDVNAPLYYAGGRLLLDPQANVDALIGEYFKAEAGEQAGSLLARFWNDLESQLKNASDFTAFGANLPKVFTPEIFEKWDQLIRDLENIESQETKDVARRWKFRRDVAKRILDMLARSKFLIEKVDRDPNSVLGDYMELVLYYDALLEDIRASSYRDSFDPLLPKFLASNILRPVVKRLQKLGVAIPEKSIRGVNAGGL